MQVRRARPEDAQAIEVLYKQLVEGDRNVSVSPERVAALATDASNFLLAAEIDGRVSGTAFLTMCLDPMYGFQPYGVVENVTVLESARGKGIGAALMEEVERLAREARCTKLMLLSASSRTSAHAFFRSVGYDSDRKRGFVKYLNRPTGR